MPELTLPDIDELLAWEKIRPARQEKLEACLLELKRLKTLVKPSFNDDEPSCPKCELVLAEEVCGVTFTLWHKFCPNCGIPLNWEGK